MKKNLFLRLCLILMVALTIFSCRTDHLPEQETTYSNNSKFQLTSKRTSLDEAKHKDKLVTELNKAEAKIKTISKTNAQGKIVNYGNGVSIDTDNVIYIENGPDFYTYTFRIDRENALENAPVENLVLSPLSDGSYRELLVSYNLTTQEKQALINGDFVNLQEKVQTTELASGTYSGQIFSKTTTQCHWETYIYYTPCACHPGHYDASECTCIKGKPKQYVLTWNVCEEVEDTAPGGGAATPENSPGGGSTDPNTGIIPNQPCEGSIPSQPEDPNSTLGTNEGCNPSTPTLPNLEFNPPKTPCEKIKKVGKHEDTKALFENLKTKTNSTKEFGEILQENNGQINNASIEGEIGQAGIIFNISGQIDGFLHSHYTGLLSVFSPADLATLSGFYKNGNIKDPNTFILGLVTASNTQYMIVIDDIAKFDIFAQKFILPNGQINQGYVDAYGQATYIKYNIKQNNLSNANELGFVKLLSEKNSGLKILKGSNNSTTWEELVIKDGKIDPKPCN
ncbi:hypothetical protein AB4Y90_07545 [Chryseobacterium sp. 2TAF14]|uniref:hypothetical protein n=1 Tax=Chryseobacterium sp. 2TAF14 TaxID=3233007 RepID=UPI003F8ED8D6